MDIVFTNGDAFDNFIVNPSHGVQWLENDGQLQFTYHRLTDMVGAVSPKAGDIDGDGDQDIITVAWIPESAEPKAIVAGRLPSVICLEQTAPGKFARHTLEAGFPRNPAIEMADFDGDGDLDFAIGSNSINPSLHMPYWIAVWWNGG
jgi:hypothetical protein